MDDVADHYAILGLPTGEEGAKCSEKEIQKAYKKKALELHPDKRPGDQEAAHADIQRLNASYAILKDETARKLFDDLLRAKLQKARRHAQRDVQYDSKRRKMMSDLERREREAFADDPEVIAREEEERISRKFKEEVARIRAEHAAKVQAAWIGKAASSKEAPRSGMNVGGQESTTGLDKEKVLKVSWEKFGVDYSAEKLRVLFENFGDVEDVVMRNTKKKGSALVIMASKDAVVAATGQVLGDLSNPLLVMPLQPVVIPSTQNSSVPESSQSGNPVAAGHKSFEASVLDKLRKAGEKQKLSSRTDL